MLAPTNRAAAAPLLRRPAAPNGAALRPSRRRCLFSTGGAAPGVEDHFIQAGTLAAQQGDPEEAIRQFTLAAMANPTSIPSYCLRAECRVALGEYTEAIDDFTKATQLAPDMMYVHRYLGECHAAVGDLDAASAAYMTAIELAGELDADVRLGYASMLLRVGQSSRAVNRFNDVLDLLPGTGSQVQEAWLGKARAYLQLGKADDAESSFKSSLVEDEDGGESDAWRRRGAMEAHAALAALAMQGGRTHEAVLRYTEAVEATQQEVASGSEEAEELGYTLRTLRCHRAAALLASSDYDGALKDCDDVLREQVAANADALLIAFVTRAQCRAAQSEWGYAVDDFTAYLDATRQADAESSLDASPEATARRR